MKNMTYEAALAYLAGLRRFGMKPGLDRTAALLERLGRPDRRVGRVVHITGTSGKGSVAAMVEAGLRAAGRRVGLFTSPPLTRFTERMQVNRAEIPEEDVARLTARLAGAAEAVAAAGLEPPTEFEVITAMAFAWFAEQSVDDLVLEAGMGGRFDATTAAEAAAVTAITNVGLDHTQWLGETHEQIARDKAGIIRPGVPCVTGTDHPGALAVIEQAAREQGAPLLHVTPADFRVLEAGLSGQVADLRGERGWYRRVRLSLLGRHQAANAAVALRILELLGVEEDAIRAGFGRVTWPGRMELIRLPEGPLVLLDAAHNPAKCRALAEAVPELFPGRRIHLLLGMLADKDVADSVAPLLPLAAEVWAATPESPRALPAADLAEVCRRQGHPARVIPDVHEALQAARAAAAPGDLLLITGSFHTVGPARGALVPRPVIQALPPA